MFARESVLFLYMLGYLKKLVVDIDDARLSEQPAKGMNPPLWILGHLAMVNDYALKYLGRSGECPQAWHDAFGPGSSAESASSPKPTKAELLASIDSTTLGIVTAAKSASPEAMAKPHGIDFLEKGIPTTGDLITHIMTSHIGIHLGQLSAWRRAAGLPSTN